MAAGVGSAARSSASWADRAARIRSGAPISSLDELAQGARSSGAGAAGGRVVSNLTSRGTLTNLHAGDVAVLESRGRTLVQDNAGRYWLESSNGNRITPSGRYDFVTMPDGKVRVARPNQNPDFSTHLGLSGGGEVRYAGSLHFENSSSAGRGSIVSWTNDSGHYSPPSSLGGNANLPMESFDPTFY